MKFDFDNSYWYGNGAEQAKFDEMNESGFQFTKTSESAFHRYYRFFNDGDCPSTLKRVMQLPYEARESHPDYVSHCQKLEAKVTERILVEYRRFEKARKA